MFLEWLLVALLLGGAIFILFRRGSPRLRAFSSTLAVAGLFGTGIWQAHLNRESASRASLSVPRIGRPDEYAGSGACRACHAEQYTTWHRSFHRTMTQIASPESIRGTFAGQTLTLDGESYKLEQRGTEFWVEMPDPEAKMSKPSGRNPPRVQRRISMVTGSHHMQAYWVANQHGNQQFSFPFTYLFEQERWVPRRSVFLMDPRATNWAQIWNVGCIGCHSTAGQPGQMPSASDFNSRVAELGIACEACHGPAARHVSLNSDPLRRYRLHLQKKGDDGIANPARLSSKRSSEVCGRCHSIHTPPDKDTWLREGDSFHAGEELESKLRVIRTPVSLELRQSSFWSDGMIRVSGREYNGLLKTPCFQKGDMSCLSCHSMHQSDPANQLAKGMDSNAACVSCHQPIAQNLERHTHHSAASTGSLCYNCHMPYTTYGLLKALRSHQISSPSVKTTLETGRPNACNLCHLDKSLAWTAQNLSAWNKAPSVELPPKEKAIAASVLWAMQGDAGQRALIAWHMGWSPARQASGTNWLAPYLATLIQDPYPAVRYIAGRSLTRLPGFAEIAYDYLAPSDQLSRAAEQVFALAASKAKPGPNPGLLLNRQGRFDDAAASALLNARNHRVVELNE